MRFTRKEKRNLIFRHLTKCCIKPSDLIILLSNAVWVKLGVPTWLIGLLLAHVGPAFCEKDFW